jgi:two-component system NtrC family sensor kinase
MSNRIAQVLSMVIASIWKIVLIDDEEDIREVMAIALQDRGYWVETAADGAAGIRLCEEALPQMVITDIRMPGMDGLQVLETIKKQLPDIEVIVATAFGEMDLAIRALQLDASDFITKPISDDALYLALNRARERYTSRKQIKDYTALLEKEKAETSQQLYKTIAFQRNLIENSMDGILGCDETDLVVTYNQSLEQILGYPKIEVLHKMTFGQFFAAGQAKRFRQDLSAERFGGQDRLNLYETTLQSKSGRHVPVQVSAVTLFGESRANGLVCFFRDLRKIRELEREMADQARILHQDKMMSLGRLAASVVHEINNPLSGILNYLRLMARILRQGTLTQERKEKFQGYLELVETETRRCSQIVSNLLSFSRKSSPSFADVHIDELIQRCVILSQHRLQLGHINLDANIQPGLPMVKGDFNQLQQCVINLIFNAIDAMGDGGDLKLEARFDSRQKLVTITVKDSGPGIAPDDLPRIFEPFYTTKKEGFGVGLGLSTVYGIMQHHRGTVSAESTPGQGAAFMLQLPVSPDEQGD